MLTLYEFTLSVRYNGGDRVLVESGKKPLVSLLTLNH